MTTRTIRFTILLCLLTLVGCARFPVKPEGNQPGSTTTPGGSLTTVIPETPFIEEASTPSPNGELINSTQTAEGAILHLWLPQEFDPAGSSPASQLLKARLDEFVAEHPGVQLEVRVKAVDGQGGLLDALSAANAAAPLALPDLVLLPRPLLESAALKGLLHPYDGLSSLMDDPSWFEYARQLAHLKGSTYGMPFVGDAYVLAYHPSIIDKVPNSLESAISLGEGLLFPATDPQALFTLGNYLASGESLQDAEGRPSLNKETLTNVLDIYQRASQAGVMPYWITQFSNDAQVWEAFSGQQFPMAVTWASSYLKQKHREPADLYFGPLPTPTGAPFTLATGWSWALAGKDAEHRALSVSLAEFLVEKDFIAAYSNSAGYLPPRVDALQGWQDADLRRLVEQISYSAQLMPPMDLISNVGPAVEQAVVDVLKAQSDAQNAAQGAIDQISLP